MQSSWAVGRSIVKVVQEKRKERKMHRKKKGVDNKTVFIKSTQKSLFWLQEDTINTNIFNTDNNGQMNLGKSGLKYMQRVLNWTETRDKTEYTCYSFWMMLYILLFMISVSKSIAFRTCGLHWTFHNVFQLLQKCKLLNLLTHNTYYIHVFILIQINGQRKKWIYFFNVFMVAAQTDSWVFLLSLEYL